MDIYISRRYSLVIIKNYSFWYAYQGFILSINEGMRLPNDAYSSKPSFDWSSSVKFLSHSHQNVDMMGFPSTIQSTFPDEESIPQRLKTIHLSGCYSSDRLIFPSRVVTIDKVAHCPSIITVPRISHHSARTYGGMWNKCTYL